MKNLSAHLRHFYIGGSWIDPLGTDVIDVVDPSTEEAIAIIAAGSASDIDRAVREARLAFDSWSHTTVDHRILILRSIEQGFFARKSDLCNAISIEMGVPISAAHNVHFASGPAHFAEIAKVLKQFAFDELRGTTMITREPIGVCGLITPWNFPINQLTCKIAPALAAGCTMVLKPSEVSPLSALIIAEILHDAGVPAGVFNLVNGTGPIAGRALAQHPDVAMISFTGSTRAGIEIAKTAADTVKRVAQELGGKSPNILLPDADFQRSVTLGANRCFNNTGQSCVAPTRMLVPHERLEEATALAVQAAEAIRIGSPSDALTNMGPLSTRAQFEKVQRLIQQGIDEGATLACGGLGRPHGLDRGYFVRPTVFTNVDNRMVIAREEIFGPVLCVIPYGDEEDAIRIANDTCYGLGAFIQSADLERARRVARRLRAGNVQINYPAVDRGAPFGGYGHSGNGREWGEFGLLEYLEVKGIQGFTPGVS